MMFVLLVSFLIGFKTGEANTKAEIYSDRRVCFNYDYEDRKNGCYEIGEKPKKFNNLNRWK